jgi:hypothetical protein
MEVNMPNRKHLQVFTKAVEKHFGFLFDRYKMNREYAEDSAFGVAVWYANATTCLAISSEIREGVISIFISPLTNGMCARGLQGDRLRVTLEEILDWQSEDTSPILSDQLDVTSEPILDAILPVYARVLDDSCSSVLDGDFSLWPELLARRKRLRELYR